VVGNATQPAPVFYGRDRLASDGTVLYVDIGDAHIGVGSCSDDACSDIPAGVYQLALTLLMLDSEARARGTCASAFESP
jgi:hypothetical protein